MLVQRRRDTLAALRLMRKLLKKQGFAPKLLVTGKLRSYGSAFRRLGLTCRHGSIRPTLSQHARRHSQHLQSASPPRLPIYTAHLPSGSYRTVAQRCRGGMTPGEFRLSTCGSFPLP